MYWFKRRGAFFYAGGAAHGILEVACVKVAKAQKAECHIIKLVFCAFCIHCCMVGVVS